VPEVKVSPLIAALCAEATEAKPISSANAATDKARPNEWNTIMLSLQ
jgi:hypothetical protein